MAETPIIEAIKSKISRLIADNEMLRDDLTELSKQRDRLKSENRELIEKISVLEKRVKVLELKEGIEGATDDTKLAKARINNLMREIDKCIALMNR